MKLPQLENVKYDATVKGSVRDYTAVAVAVFVNMKKEDPEITPLMNKFILAFLATAFLVAYECSKDNILYYPTYNRIREAMDHLVNTLLN